MKTEFETSITMDDLKKFYNKSGERREEAEENHESLSELFRLNRFMFEIKRKKLIEEMIENANEKTQEKLRVAQKSWDKRLNSAGSEYNRYVMAKNLFWDFIINKR